MSSANQLIHETSPYLLQHAHNPVNWLPFGTQAFTRAQNENKPLLISIGYSSCHWCHVMEHESFENEDIAKLMNDNFVCVKVDREERPDVDHVFMDAVHQIHGNGGWPLNCFALPDGRPFWGGTYFRTEEWRALLINIAELFHNRLPDIENQAGEIADGVARQNYLLNDYKEKEIEDLDIQAIHTKLYNAFDQEKGGMAGALKFPMPVVLKFMMHYGSSHKIADALKIVGLTMRKMALGGIYDQAGGGFARYSTDSDWKVPHFEKMLYDNAQLVSLYATAYNATGNILYKGVVEQTLEFIKRELTSPEGIFYSALDADSEGEEGLFYTFSAEQFIDALGHYAPLAGEYYGIGKHGLWENGRNILVRPENDEIFAQQHFLSSEELAALTVYCRNQLLIARSSRPGPGLDDKMLVAWNSLMITALVDASVSTDRNDYLKSALHTARFMLQHLKRPDKGLYHTWKNGKSRINAFLDDYAFTCEAFLKLYSVTADLYWLNEADVLAGYVTDHFFDSQSGFFWYSENAENHVFARKIEIYDGVIPSGNSVMAHVLNALGIFLQKDDYSQKVHRMISVMSNRILLYPAAYANWASLALYTSNEYVIAVIGNDSVTLIKELSKKNFPGVHILGSQVESDLPYFVNRFEKGKTLIYICSGSFCMAPVETVDEVIQLLSSRLSN